MDTRTRNAYARALGYTDLACRNIPKGTPAAQLAQTLRHSITAALEDAENVQVPDVTATHAAAAAPAYTIDSQTITIPAGTGWYIDGAVVERPDRRYNIRTIHGLWAVWSCAAVPRTLTVDQALYATLIASRVAPNAQGVISVPMDVEGGHTTLRVNLLAARSVK